MSNVECRSGCGHCCNPVVLPITQLEAAQTLPTSRDEADDRRFILEDLTPIPFKIGMAASPHLKNRTLASTANGGLAVQPNFYSCRHYDTATRTCTNYEHRPPVCRGFPRYDLAAIPSNMALPFECTYNEDIPIRLRNRPPEGWKPDLLEGTTFE